MPGRFEAFWLHWESEADDCLVPIISLGRIEPYRPIFVFEALDIIHSEAELIADMDDTMGD